MRPLWPTENFRRTSMRAWAKQHLTAYKVPRRFVEVEELPTNLLGKVVRREVVDLIPDD